METGWKKKKRKIDSFIPSSLKKKEREVKRDYRELMEEQEIGSYEYTFVIKLYSRRTKNNINVKHKKRRWE